MADEPLSNSLADRVRSYICDTADGPLGHGDHGHTDCWHLSMAADIIEARDDYARRQVADGN